MLVENARHSGSDRERGRLTNSRELKAYTPSKPLAWNKDKEYAERRIDEDRHSKDHDCPAGKELSDVRLPNPGKVERGVLAKADKGKNWVEGILVGSKAVNADCERQNELWKLAMNCPRIKQLPHTQSLTIRDSSRKIKMKAAQNPPNMDTSPRIRRIINVGGIRFPSAFILRNPGKASRSIAWKT